MAAPASTVDLSKPKYEQTTYVNRAKHFFLLTNPLNLLVSPAQLERARQTVLTAKNDPKQLDPNLTEEQLWDAKYLYDSAYHPDTGEKMFLLGRMSAQMPMNMLVTGAMITFYRSTPAVVFWQWFNQTFNAVVNYTNRSGDSPMSNEKLITSYVLATGGALTTALSLKHFTKNLNPLIGRLVPVIAVSAANFINIPLMRSIELTDGIPLVDENNEPLNVKSRKAAVQGISAVVLSRIGMAMPGMVLTPIIVQRLTDAGFFKRYPRSNVPVQIGLVGAILIFATPLGCAFFSQTASIRVENLDAEIREVVRKTHPNLEVAWFNKGL